MLRPAAALRSPDRAAALLNGSSDQVGAEARMRQICDKMLAGSFQIQRAGSTCSSRAGSSVEDVVETGLHAGG